MPHAIIIWIVSVAAIAGVVFRPFRVPEAIWAVAAALLLIVFRSILPRDALSGVARGTDVYLFLLGMMLLAEVAREEKLFDWLAVQAVRHARGSPKRLFGLIYLVGIAVTVLLSNDATAVVLTPAVAAAVKAARVTRPLPYLLICAFIANAASFVLPISNPANLVIYGSHMPALLEWLPRYILPSVISILITYLLLYRTQRKALVHPLLEKHIDFIPVGPEHNAGASGIDESCKAFARGRRSWYRTHPHASSHSRVLSPNGRIAAIGLGVTAIVLLTASALDWQLGLPTAITGILTAALVLAKTKKNPLIILRGISWSVLPLVAGLFVIVEAINKTGVVRAVSALLQQTASHSPARAAWASGIGIALFSNLANNLPSGLIAADAVQNAHVPEVIRNAILIGVDLGPNLSVTGSLATILWLVALRREGQAVSAWNFLKLGLLIMTPTLVATLAALWV
jgi:arsenical pump membrane protein